MGEEYEDACVDKGGEELGESEEMEGEGGVGGGFLGGTGGGDVGEHLM